MWDSFFKKVLLITICSIVVCKCHWTFLNVSYISDTMLTIQYFNNASRTFPPLPFSSLPPLSVVCLPEAVYKHDGRSGLAAVFGK